MPSQELGQELGTVYIVGTGPGDPELLTVRARTLIDMADTIVYDALVNTDVLPPGALDTGTPELFDVGKRVKGRAPSSGEIQELVITLAREGKRVVHLTGGDPFVFGRGSEEAQALQEAQIPFEIVPGITAGIGATAYAGIPVTHRSLSTSVTFVTGLDGPDDSESRTDWQAVARVGGTIVIYNGLSTLPSIARALKSAGTPGEIPAAAIQSGTYAHQRTVIATLDTLTHEALIAGVGGAVTVVIGWTVVLRDEVAWFDNRPLSGRRIAIMPSAGENPALRDRLRELGAGVIEFPAARAARLDLSEIREEMLDLSEYGWIIFTSTDAVAIFWEQLLTLGRDSRALARSRVAAIGAPTAAALLDRGITVDVIPERFEARGLIDALALRGDVAGARVLFVGEDDDDTTVADEIRAFGAEVVASPVYRFVYDDVSADKVRRALERGAVDLVVVTSPTAAVHYARAVGEDHLTRVPAAATDDSTAHALRGAGVDVAVEGERGGSQELAAAIVRSLAMSIL